MSRLLLRYLAPGGLAIALGVILPAPAGAAATRPAAPAVIGTVTDTAGVPLANATVVVAEVARSTTTNAAGAFVLRGLPAGEYHLSVTHLGYAPGHAVVRVPPEGDDVRVTVVLVPTTLRLTSVVVSASPTGTESERLTQSAVELSGRALNRSLGSSVAATLSAEPGVSQRFAGPAASMPVIRGLTGDRILVLQDGERAGDIASSASDHAVSVDPLAAQRIEVIRGPASLLYGNNAIGGVVNVVTNDIPTAVPSHLEGYVAGQGESVTPGGAIGAGLTMGLGARSALAVRGGYRDLGDLRTGGDLRLDGTDSRATNATVGYGFVGERLNAGLAARIYDFAYGIPAEPGDPEAGVRIDGRRVGLSGRGGLQLGGGALRYLRVEGSAQDYAHDELEPDGAVGTQLELRTQTLNAQVNTTFGRARGAIGLQGLFKQYEAAGDEALTPAARSTGIGAFLFQELPLRRGADDEDAPQVQLGGRFDSYGIRSQTGDPRFGPGRSLSFNSASGSLGLSLPLRRGLSFSTSGAVAFRAPTVEELFSNGVHHATASYDIGNANLRTERSVGGEAILRVRGDRVSAQLSAYRTAIQDYVTTVATGDTIVDGETLPVLRYVQSEATLSGVEANLEAQLAPSVVLSLMGDLVRGDLRDLDTPVPFLPPARLGAGVRWERRAWFANADVRHAFAQDRVSGGDVDVATEAYTVVNLGAGWQWLGGNVLHSITLRADNVGDTRYFDAASRIKRFAANPGRNISLLYRVIY